MEKDLVVTWSGSSDPWWLQFVAERDVDFCFVRNLGFCFISWQRLNLKIIILVGVVVQKTRSAILLDLSLWHLPNSKDKGTLFIFTKLHCFVLCQ